MSGTYAITMGDSGRLVIPAELRARTGLDAGAPLVLVETGSGLVVMTRDQARDHLRTQLAGTNLVDALLTERRAAAQREDAA